MSEVIDLCRRLVQFPSLGGNTDEAIIFLQKYLDQCGFTTRILTYTKQGNPVRNLCASYGTGHPHLLFAGHIDVVPAGDEKQWQYPPFEAVIEKDVLFGRGIADMKGGVACFVKACEDFIRSGSIDGKITIILSGDEEEPIVEGTRLVLEQLQNEGEKFDFALVGEPSNPKTMSDEIKIGRRGDIVLNITSYGQSGHTAYAPCSSNAAHNLINLLYAMQNNKLDEGNEFFGPSALHVTTVDVGNHISNVVPSNAFARVDVRFNSEHSCQSVEKWAKSLAQQVGGNFEIKSEYIGESFLSPINESIRELRKIIKTHTGREPSYSTAGGTSDARFVKNYCPVVEYGLTNATIHKIDECETIQNIEILYAVYKDFLRYFFTNRR